MQRRCYMDYWSDTHRGQKGSMTAAGGRTLRKIKASYRFSLCEQSDHMHRFSILVTHIVGIRRRKSRD